jgi:ribosomal protein L7/L12
MKLREFKKIIAGMHPAAFAPAFERCHNVSEVQVAIEAFGLARAELSNIEKRYRERDLEQMQAVAVLEARIDLLDQQIASRQMVQVREAEEPREEVILTKVQPQVGRTFVDRIEVIKAVREVSGMGLKDAKDLVDEVADKGFERKLFTGVTSKAAVAARVLEAAGGVVVRKEAF